MVGWATSNYFVGPIQVIPKAKIFMANFHKMLPLGKEDTLAHDVTMKKAELDDCPFVSPNLSKYLLFLFCTTKNDLTDVQRSTKVRRIQPNEVSQNEYTLESACQLRNDVS